MILNKDSYINIEIPKGYIGLYIASAEQSMEMYLGSMSHYLPVKQDVEEIRKLVEEFFNESKVKSELKQSTNLGQICGTLVELYKELSGFKNIKTNFPGRFEDSLFPHSKKLHISRAIITIDNFFTDFSFNLRQDLTESDGLAFRRKVDTERNKIIGHYKYL